MYKYTCGITVEADSANHAKDKLSSVEGVFSVITQDTQQVLCTPEYYWEPGFGWLSCFIALCVGIGLGVTSKRK